MDNQNNDNNLGRKNTAVDYSKVDLKKSNNYNKYKTKTTVFSAIFIPQVVMFIGLMALIFLYNITCAGCSCDGSTARGCTPSEEPFLFFLIFIWFVEIIVMAANAFINFRKMDKSSKDDSEE